MRLDRIISLYVVRPFCREDSNILPILMYHSISDAAEVPVSPYYQLCTELKRFDEHMTLISDSGYRGVNLESALTQREHRTVAITFDDGYADAYENALPVLAEHGFTASMYLPTAFIGNERRKFKNQMCMSWSEARELQDAGWQFGSHTVNHLRLYRQPWKRIRAELYESRMELEDRLQVGIGSFAYPYAFPQADNRFIERFTDVLVETGYLSSVTTRIGRMQPHGTHHLLPRLPVNGADDATLLLAKLLGAYDWLATPQKVVKQLKHRFFMA